MFSVLVRSFKLMFLRHEKERKKKEKGGFEPAENLISIRVYIREVGGYLTALRFLLLSIKQPTKKN